MLNQPSPKKCLEPRKVFLIFPLLFMLASTVLLSRTYGKGGRALSELAQLNPEVHSRSEVVQFDMNELSKLSRPDASAVAAVRQQSSCSKEGVRLIVAVNHFNQPGFLAACLKTIQNQSYGKYRVAVVDDGSAEEWTGELQRIRKYFGYDERFQFYYNKENMGSIASLMHAFEGLKPKPDDVVVWVDGDDFLVHDRVFEMIAKIYESGDVDVTFGSFMTAGVWRCCDCNAFNWTDIAEQRGYRDMHWQFSHLKTFKFGLFELIRIADLQDSYTKKWIRSSCDGAVMYPILEMSGGRLKCVSDSLVYYNSFNLLNHNRGFRGPSFNTQRLNARILKALPKYEPIPSLCSRREGDETKPIVNMTMTVLST